MVWDSALVNQWVILRDMGGMNPFKDECVDLCWVLMGSTGFKSFAEPS